MASNFCSISITPALLFALLFLSSVNAVTAILAGEFDSMLDALRVRGYELFSNAIVTSDLLFDVKIKQNEDDSTDNTSFQSFTFFAPTDSSLFALDMTQTASVYTDTLRYHVVPRRLSFAELRLLSAGYSVQTLLPGRYLNITGVLGSDAIAVGGVRIAFPGLFYGRDVAVHGLAGILNLRSSTPPPADGPVRSSGRQSFRPRIGTISSNTPPVPSPPGNGTILTPALVPKAVSSHSPAVSPVVSGYSPTSSTEPPLHGHISPPAAPTALTPTPVSPEYGHSAIYLPPTEPPVNSHISAPMSLTGLTPTSASPDYSAPFFPPTESPVHGYISAPAAPTNLAPTPATTEYSYSAASLPPIGFSDGAPSPLGPDIGQPKNTPPVASLPENGTILAPALEPNAVNSHSPAVSPVVSGDSSPSLTEPHAHSHISAPAAPTALTPTPVSPEYGHSAIYLPPTEPPVHSHISVPMSPTGLTPTSALPDYSAPYLPPSESPVHSYISAPAAPTSLAPTPASPEYCYSAASSPPIGFSDRAPSPLGPDVGQPKKDRVLLMETFTGGYEGEIRTVRFADEVPETPPPLAEMKEVAEESEPFEGIVGCATPDVALGFAGSTSRDRFQQLQCHCA